MQITNVSRGIVGREVVRADTVSLVPTDGLGSLVPTDSGTDHYWGRYPPGATTSQATPPVCVCVVLILYLRGYVFFFLSFLLLIVVCNILQTNVLCFFSFQYQTRGG